MEPVKIDDSTRLVPGADWHFEFRCNDCGQWARGCDCSLCDECGKTVCRDCRDRHEEGA